MANTLYEVKAYRVGKRVLGRYVHRMVWEAKHGPIPEGYVVHHKDGDRRNNDIANLECLPKAEHHSLHMREIARQPERIEHARKLGSRVRERIEITCAHCGDKAMKTANHARWGTPRFCTSNCARRVARARATKFKKAA